MATLAFTAPLMAWRTESHGNMGYVLIEGEPAAIIRGAEFEHRFETGRRGGFGSVKVEARIGGSQWLTSVFPQRGGRWFLPVKKAICRAEDLETGDLLEITLNTR